MNQKTYCPLGKIDCGGFVNVDENKNILCRTFDECSARHFCGDIELCPIPSKQQKIERYNMCEDQPAQINCRRTNCSWYDIIGKCKNISPAIHIWHNGILGYSYCFSFKESGIK